jgi:hypothetical protein
MLCFKLQCLQHPLRALPRLEYMTSQRLRPIGETANYHALRVGYVCTITVLEPLTFDMAFTGWFLPKGGTLGRCEADSAVLEAAMSSNRLLLKMRTDCNSGGHKEVVSRPVLTAHGRDSILFNF